MKKRTWIVLGLCVSLSGWWAPVVQEAVAQEMEAVSQQEREVLMAAAVTPFLQALQSGDTQTLERLIGGKLGLTLGKLLRENAEYPNYLRQRYGDTTVQAPIQIMQQPVASSGAVGTERGVRTARVQLQTPAGGQDHFLLHLEQDAQSAWKVIDKTRSR